MPAEIIRDDRVRYAVRPELEGCQRCALVAWTGLVDPYVHRYTGVMRHIDRRKGSPPIDAGKPTRVAVSENIEASVGGSGKSADDFQAMNTNQTALLNIGVTDRGSLPKRHVNALLRPNLRQRVAHSRQRPSQVDGRWTRCLQYSNRFSDVRVRGVRAYRERNAVCRGCSDQRRATHDHGFDCPRRIGDSFEFNGGELEGQTRLI